MAIRKVLVANRGEIACRVMRTAKRLGIRTVAVYSQADVCAPHVAQADEAVCIGPAPVGESYLKVEAILAAAKASGADAVHPGYGFLSENAGFAQACAAAHLNFIGPPAAAIDLMGNKRGAKIAMIKAGVPCVPGYEGDDQSDATLIAEAKKIGMPVMIKAAAGGGGRGMRLVADEADLAGAMQSARSEAKNAFGSDELILEKAIVQPRHVEIQVFGDKHGNVIHLGERDCSVQRRHQKVIEESPSPAVDAKLRAQMGEAAVNAAKACGYYGAGTCEFILDQSGHFYFLEMNTRLQVEHPVTEMVTGQDLVEWQFRVANGEPLPLGQSAISLTGHAIEARLYAEDPAQNFMPQTGKIVRWQLPLAGDIRVDAGIVEGGDISPFYDPMIAKLIAYGPTRDIARQKLMAALDDTVILGLNTNKTFLKQIVAHAVFAKGEATTAFIAEHLQGGGQTPPVATTEWALAAMVAYLRSVHARPGADAMLGWRNASPVDALYKFGSESTHAWVTVGMRHGQGFELGVAVGAPTFLECAVPETMTFAQARLTAGELVYTDVGGVVRRCRYGVLGETIYLDVAGGNRAFVDLTQAPPAKADGAGSGVLKAPLDGAVIAVKAEVGDQVKKGQVLIVVEAMKMEHQIKADIDGKVKALFVKPGVQAKTRQILAEIEGD